MQTTATDPPAHTSAPHGLVMVDDNRLAAEAMASWFRFSASIRWLGWTDDPEVALALAAQHNPAAVLLDVDIPGVDSFALLRRFVAERPSVQVVMFSGHTQPALIGRALEEGAAGYIFKEEPMATIADLLVRAAKGGCVLSPAASAAFMHAGAAKA